MKFLIASTVFLLAIFSGCENQMNTSRHNEHPKTDKNPGFDSEELITRIRSSEYYGNLQPLAKFITGKQVIKSETGNSGFILLLANQSWAAAYRDGSSVGSSFGTGSPDSTVRKLIRSSLYGNASEPIPHDVIYAKEYCDIEREVAKSHGNKITGLAYGENSFNFAFEDNRELDVRLVNDKNGKPAFRVFWEQW
jgi:hypothetical protein